MNTPLTEDEISVLALRAGMRPADIIQLLDTIARWRSLGLEIEAERLEREVTL
jgi:hypothetical protein